MLRTCRTGFVARAWTTGATLGADRQTKTALPAEVTKPVVPGIDGRGRTTAICSIRPARYNDRMSSISVQEIERDPLAFLRRVEAGEGFVVLRGEQALAEVRPLATAAAQPRPFGLCAGQFTVPADFDQPLPDDILKHFEGS